LTTCPFPVIFFFRRPPAGYRHFVPSEISPFFPGTPFFSFHFHVVFGKDCPPGSFSPLFSLKIPLDVFMTLRPATCHLAVKSFVVFLFCCSFTLLCPSGSPFSPISAFGFFDWFTALMEPHHLLGDDCPTSLAPFWSSLIFSLPRSVLVLLESVSTVMLSHDWNASLHFRFFFEYFYRFSPGGFIPPPLLQKFAVRPLVHFLSMFPSVFFFQF